MLMSLSRVLALSVCPLGIPALAGASTLFSSAESPDAGLLTRLQRIESAFRQGDATSLRLSFSGAGKIRVDLGDLTDGQESYGAGQLQVIFGRIFEELRTQEFSFAKDAVKVSAPGTAFARGRWVRRSRPSGDQTIDTLIFTLREELGDWRILEIRSSR